MDDLIAKETEKELAFRFQISRDLRNSIMHPHRHSYSGSMSKNFILHTVILLNTLFLPGMVFTNHKTELEKIQKAFKSFQEKVSVIERCGKRFLILDLRIIGCIKRDRECQYLLIGQPIMLNAYNNLTNHNYLEPISGWVKDIIITEESIVAYDEVTNDKITITPTNHPDDIGKYQSFLSDLALLDNHNKEMYDSDLKYEIGKIERDFWYEKLWTTTV